MSAISVPAVAVPRQTSLFVNGYFPRRRAAILGAGLFGGFLLAFLWKASLVDDAIGFNAAHAMLGHDARTTPISGVASGVLFAFVTGLAGSFTACNVAVFGAVGPLLGQSETRRARLADTLRPIGWLGLGTVSVSAAYGALVGVMGTRMPQYSTKPSHGLSPRALQAMVSFGLVGVVMIACGLAALGILRDPLAPLARRFSQAPLVLMGMLIGLFLVGRPYPLFRAMFRHAAETHNPAYGAVAFALQSIGNTLIMALLFLLLSAGLRGRVQRWLAEKPARVSVLTATAFLVAGAFNVAYWDVRVAHGLGYLWFPTAPWNG
jgi:cytochrome c biogenesis protein CcdA